MRKRAAYCWLTGASRTERSRSRGGIRVGWVDIEASLQCGSPQLDFERNRRCQPICFVSSTVSNNFSSACYSRWEYQTAIIRFLTSHFIEQIASRLPIWHCSRTESYGRDSLICIIPRHLDADFASKVITYPPPQSYPGAKYLGAFLVSVRGPHLPTNRFVWEIH